MMPDRAADVLGEFDAKDRYPSPIPPPESAATLQRPKEAGHSINFSEVLNLVCRNTCTRDGALRFGFVSAALRASCDNGRGEERSLHSPIFSVPSACAEARTALALPFYLPTLVSDGTIASIDETPCRYIREWSRCLIHQIGFKVWGGACFPQFTMPGVCLGI